MNFHYFLGLVVELGSHRLGGGGQPHPVRVADRHDPHAGQLAELCDVGPAAHTAADHGQANLLVGAHHPWTDCQRSACGHA